MPKLISPFTAGCICAGYRNYGSSYAELAKQFNVSKNTIGVILRSYDEHGNLTQPQRVRNLQTAFQKKIKVRRNMMKRYAKATCVKGGRKFVKHGSARCIREAALIDPKNPVKKSVRTIQRDLKAAGLKCLVRKKCSSLKPQHVSARLKFSQTFKQKYKYAYQTWNDRTNMFKKIVFSDEHTCTGNDHSLRTMWVEHRRDVVPREVGNPFNTKRMMIWAAIGYNYKSELVTFDVNKKNPETEKKYTQTQHTYHRRCLIGTGVMQKCFDEKLLFMQDGSKTHTANKCKDYIARKGVRLIDNWPAHTPRLNPIEKVWDLLDQKISDMGQVTSVEELERNIRKAWKDIPLETINNYVLSFEQSLKECRAAKGEY